MDRPTDRPSLFTFITGDDFRKSLESDYQELQTCKAGKAWKSVHVLAGSIVEAVLVDYLVSSGCSGKDPLKMTLDEAVTACERAGVLSDTAVKLSAVIRAYRNLIHPGRVVRLQQEIDQDSATVAESLVHMVVKDVTREKRKTYGYTAEQIVSKLELDASSMHIFGHLLKQVNGTERERLLLDMIPDRYLDTFQRDDWEICPSCDDLRKAYRLVFDAVGDEVKRKAVAKYVRILKEESGFTLIAYEQAFFRAKDLLYADGGDLPIIKQRLFSTPKNATDPSVFKPLEGLYLHLTDPKEASTFLGSVLDIYFARRLADEAKSFLLEEDTEQTRKSGVNLPDLLEERASQMDRWGSETKAKAIRELKVYLEGPPF